MKAWLSLLIILVGLFNLLVAYSHQQATDPLELLWKKTAKNNEILVIFLPGVRDDKEDFLNKGMFGLLREMGLRTDLVAADLHLA
ncbi:hypothetical protein BMS3Bbin11_00483 [bacterium BMS3Bbin11]|nr:hypothetical protein BMS3Abin11_02404 [bacterium BMS3Abin11]GBE45397.1 hypothetical protein BMS3Bbin11_00483 [bacterium BMS3Bbin11]GMT41230.1 MAG: hypothetical protein IEMM0001_1965 [bacterium]HDH08883.1 hypothetical protein [Gammaproteobacteria bacterium]HDH15109.1 hypothetical protein [Gammaproteobacteria bacterium]